MVNMDQRPVDRHVYGPFSFISGIIIGLYSLSSVSVPMVRPFIIQLPGINPAVARQPGSGPLLLPGDCLRIGLPAGGRIQRHLVGLYRLQTGDGKLRSDRVRIDGDSLVGEVRIR